MNKTELIQIIRRAADERSERLELQNQEITSIPEEIGLLTDLKELHLLGNALVEIPSAIAELKQLRVLSLARNSLKELPPQIGELSQLRELYLDRNRLISLPETIGQLHNLEVLFLIENQLVSLPESFAKMRSLGWVTLARNSLKELPPQIGELSQVRKLYLDTNGLISLPATIGQLLNLEELLLDRNQLGSLPESFAEMGSLRLVTLDDNLFVEFPLQLSRLPRLEELSISGNKLTALPSEVGGMRSLRKLHVARNPITRLPAQLGQLEKLDLLEFDRSRLEFPPPNVAEQGPRVIIDFLRGHVPEVAPQPPSREDYEFEVYISYAHEDREFAKKLGSALRARTRRVFFDLDLYGGDAWPDELRKAYESAAILLFIISPNSLASRYALRELRQASADKKPILPILYRTINVLPPELEKIFHISVEEAGSFESLLDKVESAINRLIAITGAARLGKPQKRGPQIPRFNDDLAAGTDCMNIERDVNAMANLIASKTLQPPLAIGLFGQWGSGKSFFMNKLEGAVGGFAELARKDKKRAGDYWPNIVQIQFNAWHYVDANLWANLVAHIFEELNRWGKDAASPIQQAKETALKNLEVAKEAHAAAEARLEQAKKAVKAAEATRKERLEEVNSNKKELAQAIAIDIWEQVRKSVQLDQNTKEHLQQVGMEVDDIQKSAEQVYAYLTELGTLTGRTKAIWLSMCKGYGGWTALMIGSAILGLGVLGAGAVAKWFSEGAGIVVGFTGPVVALVAGAGNWMKKNVDLVSGAVKPLREFHAKLEQSLKAAEKAKAGKIAAIEKDLDRVNADCTEATKRLDETNRILQAAQAEVEEVVSGRLITRFIEQRAGSADYRKHLGIVAMIREDFSTLSRKIQDYNRLKMAPEPDAVEAIQAAVQDLGINRIVLYIDDLDRCPPDRVLEVLQSIHLLLAFHLFVVVVGVDARWVSYSLADQFRGMLAERGPQLVEGASGLPADAATPRDYLEKIFQVPFWIKSMEEDGCKRLIAELVKHDLQSARPAEPDTKAPEVPPNRTPAAERAIQETSAKKTPRPPPVKEPEPEPRPESLHLENNEAVTMGELARFIGRSPRATKRFVNVYRLIKAALPADEIDAFVGSASAPGPFRGVMFLLALVTGVPTLSLAALRRINHPAGDTSFWQIIDAIRNDPSIAPHDEWERLDGFLTADTDSRWESLSVAELVKSVERVEQFSFESRHTLSIAVKS